MNSWDYFSPFCRVEHWSFHRSTFSAYFLVSISGNHQPGRFTRRQIEDMLSEAGFGDIRFSDRVPDWCAGWKRTP
jgi:hypothetical protein